MEEKLESKINEMLDYIISKPIENITTEEMAIMASELRERRMHKKTTENEKQWREAMQKLSSCTFGQ